MQRHVYRVVDKHIVSRGLFCIVFFRLSKGVDEVSSGDRNKAKRVVYAVMYGVGQDKLSDILGVSLDQAKHVIASFLGQDSNE